MVNRSTGRAGGTTARRYEGGGLSSECAKRLERDPVVRASRRRDTEVRAIWQLAQSRNEVASERTCGEADASVDHSRQRESGANSSGCDAARRSQ